LFAAATYPVMAHWAWGGGWLAQAGALDAGGAGVIHAVGGLRALAITWILGPRQGKYEAHGMAIPGHNMAMVLFGCGVTLAGFLGLDAAGAMLFAGAPVSGLPLIAINLMASASAAVLTAFCVTRIRYTKPDASICANGFVAGLVAISAACSLVPPAAAIAIGFVAGLMIPLSVEWLDRLGFDDPSGAISVHGLGGLWAVLAVGVFVSRPGQWLAQLAMVSALLGFVLPVSYGLNLLLNRIYPQRINRDAERIGMDMCELGAGAYPELSAAIKDQYR
jgi:Amt family ammonium transporter